MTLTSKGLKIIPGRSFNLSPYALNLSSTAWKRIVSRVLSSPPETEMYDHSSKDLNYSRPQATNPRVLGGPPVCPPIRSCSGWGLPSYPVSRDTGGLLPRHFTLTAPKAQRYLFCGTFLLVTETGCYPASCPMELGLSSRQAKPDERSFNPLPRSLKSVRSTIDYPNCLPTSRGGHEKENTLPQTPNSKLVVRNDISF